jgi:hypothetical protein
MEHMIWFTCGQCGKAHGRPEGSVGSMIFCECGQGNVVPWESTTVAPEAAPPVAMPAPVPAPQRSDLPEILPRVRRRAGPRRPNPAYCLNHDSIASQHKCADCGEAFCDDCVLTVQGALLCGPCKNFRVRRLLRPPRLSGFALASVLIALVSGPFCLLLALTGIAWLTLLALLPQLVALVLGALALRTTETDTQRSGRSLAITGMVSAAVAGVLMLLMIVHQPMV